MTKAKNNRSRIIAVLLSLCLLLSLTLTAVAATKTSSQDGLEVTLSTDKDEYSADDTIVATLTVRNTNDVAVESVELETLIPEGYQLAEKSLASTKVDKLEPGEEVSLVTDLVKETTNPDPDNPVPSNSEDDSNSGDDKGTKDSHSDNNSSNETGSNNPESSQSGENASSAQSGENGSNNTGSSSSRSSSASGSASGSSSYSSSGSNSTSNSSSSNNSGKEISVNTGDESNLIMWIGIALSALLGVTLVWYIRKHTNVKGKALLSVLLALTFMVSSFASIPILVDADEETIQMSISTSVKYESDDLSIVGKVSYKKELPAQNEEFVLTTNVDTLIVSEEEQIVYFYLQTLDNFDKIALIDSESKEIAVMLDDGKYSESGDDIEKDGTYSAKVTLNCKLETVLRFNAVGYINGEVVQMSNDISIIVNETLSDDEMNAIEIVNLALQELVTSEDYQKLNRDDKVSMAIGVLDELEEQGYIIKDSISWIDETGIIEFDFLGDVPGGLMIDDFAEELDSPSDEETDVERTDEVDAVTSSINNDSANDASVETSSSKVSLWEATIYYSYPDSEREWRYPFFEKCITDWNESSVKTNIIDMATVKDFANIDTSVNFLIFSMHGSIYGGKPVMCTVETVNSTNKDLYKADIKAKNVSIVTTTSGKTNYWIRHTFFSAHYGSFEGNTIFVQCCNFYGHEGNIQYDFAKSFRNADSVTGFHNSVYSYYSRDMMKKYIELVANGGSPSEALTACKANYGENDASYGHNVGKLDAYPIQIINNSNTLADGLQNPSFEDSFKYWHTTGDCRIVPVLGNLTPTAGAKMALLTTGIGSAESIYLAGTEGSIIYQNFVVPMNATSISFDYDVISEEPMEFVGSKFDDQFEVLLSAKDDIASMVLAKESVNSSTWYEFEGVDFEGGDDTVYHTDWIHVEKDISQYRGKIVTLRFNIFDVGDSAYDTAAVVDNIKVA